MLIVLSHGKTDLLYAYDMSYNPEILWEPFSADKCGDLAGKPKLFFIQVGQQALDLLILYSNWKLGFVRSLFLVTGMSWGQIRRWNSLTGQEKPDFN